MSEKDESLAGRLILAKRVLDVPDGWRSGGAAVAAEAECQSSGSVLPINKSSDLD